MTPALVWQLEPGDRIVRPAMPAGTVITVVEVTRVRHDAYVRRLVVKSEVPGRPPQRCYIDLSDREEVMVVDAS